MCCYCEIEGWMSEGMLVELREKEFEYLLFFFMITGRE